MLIDVHGGTIDTREESNRPGPFGDGMSVFLHFRDDEDESRGDFTAYGTGRRFGKRVLWCDTSGFMSVGFYGDEDAASSVLNAWADWHEGEGDDEE